MTIRGRAATAEDIEQFYPGTTTSFRAWVCEIDGKVEGFIGLALVHPVACLVSTFREALRPYLKHPAVLRLIKKAQAAVGACQAPVAAAAEPGEPGAPGILTRLGFEHVGNVMGDEIYLFRGGGE